MRPERKEVAQISVYDESGRGKHEIFVFATLAEKREGVSSARGVQTTAGSGSFRWSLKRGTATLRPPAPFTGSATFVRHGHDGHGTWKGSLSMPIFGGEPVKLTGGGFRAFLHRGVPQDE